MEAGGKLDIIEHICRMCPLPWLPQKADPVANACLLLLQSGVQSWGSRRTEGSEAKKEEDHTGVGAELIDHYAWFHHDQLLDRAGLSCERPYEELPLREVPPGGEREKN